MPITLLEAGAYALPSIASRAGAITELIEDNANGILIDAGDRQALAAAIDRYLPTLHSAVAMATKPVVASSRIFRTVWPRHWKTFTDGSDRLL